MLATFKCILLIFTLDIVVADPTSGQKISINPQYQERDIANDMIEKEYINSCITQEIVRLSDMRLKELPRDLVISDSIRSIVMEDNDLNNIPRDVFKELPNLQCLDLARNRIPFQGFQLKHENLKTLILDNQRLSEWDNLPSNDCLNSNAVEVSFPSLESLSWKGINYNCLQASLSIFPSLRNIDLSNSNIQFLEANSSITNRTPYLRSIHLERNGLETLSLDNLGTVEALYLDENPLKQLWIGPMNNLKVLSLSGCTLERPLELQTQSLTILDLSHNQIRDGNTMFKYTQQLEILDLSNNNLYVFPALNNLYNLRKLSVGHNFIDRITHIIMLKSLKTLNLRDNRISVIDKMAFSQLGVLEELDLSGNELETLPPYWHEGMQMLQYLNLKSNKFSVIDAMSITDCYSLTELHIKGNYIHEIDINALQLIPDRCILHVM